MWHTHIYIYLYLYIVLKYDVWYIVSTFANWDPSSFHFAIWIIHYLTLPAAAIKWVLGSTNLQCLHEIDPFPQRDSRVSHVLLPKPLEKKRTFCPQMDKRERRLTLENYKANQWSNWAIFLFNLLMSAKPLTRQVGKSPLQWWKTLLRPSKRAAYLW